VASKPYTPEDIRFTQSKDGKMLYAIVLALPADGKITIKSLASNSPNWPGEIGSIRQLGVWGRLKFTRDENGLHITLPAKQPGQIALALKIQS
jgi:alpha-L-fucosidase